MSTPGAGPDEPSTGPAAWLPQVLVESDDHETFGTLRRRARPRELRWADGRALRDRVPRSAFAEWEPTPTRVDPVEQLAQAHLGRIDWLVPVRVGRMAASPYAFLRGAAAVHASDFAGLPSTGITPVICGDAHLGNFGFYASPERALVFDLNDFDEAHPGAWEWDLRRAVTRCARAYREQLSHLAEQPLLARAFERLDLDRLRLDRNRTALREAVERAARQARRRTSDRALPRFTETRDGARRIVEQPPLITRPSPADADRLPAR